MKLHTEETKYEGEIEDVTSNSFIVEFTAWVETEEVISTYREDDGSYEIVDINITEYKVFTSDGNEVNQQTLDFATNKEIEEVIKDYITENFG